MTRVSEMGAGVAARCWTDPETELQLMDVPLATAFAKRVDGYLDIIETAWGIIANAGGGDWSKEGDTWADAAIKWRDTMWHPMLDQNGDPPRKDDINGN